MRGGRLWRGDVTGVAAAGGAKVLCTHRRWWGGRSGSEERWLIHMDRDCRNRQMSESARGLEALGLGSGADTFQHL